MLFFVGLFFFGFGLFMIFRFFRNATGEKIDAQITKINVEYPVVKSEMAPNNRMFPHAYLEYYHQMEKREGKAMLKSKSVVGDTIKVTVKGDTVEEFYPKKDLTMAVIFTLIGVGLMVPGIYLMMK